MFTVSDRRNVVLAGVVMLVLIAACAGTIGLYKSVVAQHVDRDTINITQESYGQALAKWQAQHIMDYEISLESGVSEATLRVTGGGANVQVIRQAIRGSEVSTTDSTGELAELRQATVEHLFQLVQDALDSVQLGQDTRHSDGKFDYFYDYDVHLDGTRGFPAYFVEYERVAKPSREITWRQAVQPAIEVKELKPVR